jgi:hypothetical protein
MVSEGTIWEDMAATSEIARQFRVCKFFAAVQDKDGGECIPFGDPHPEERGTRVSKDESPDAEMGDLMVRNALRTPHHEGSAICSAAS